MKMASEISTIQSSLNTAMHDLRSTIYGYSWKQRGTSNFIADIQNAICQVKKYHEVDISFDLKGNQELLSLKHKKAFYRIINEGISNSVRHGNAKIISISMSIDKKDALLIIADNGISFDPSILIKVKKNGMGLYSIKLLVESLQGDIKINCEEGRGTTLRIQVPVNNNVYKEEAIV